MSQQVHQICRAAVQVSRESSSLVQCSPVSSVQCSAIRCILVKCSEVQLVKSNSISFYALQYYSVGGGAISYCVVMGDFLMVGLGVVD